MSIVPLLHTASKEVETFTLSNGTHSLSFTIPHPSLASISAVGNFFYNQEIDKFPKSFAESTNVVFRVQEIVRERIASLTIHERRSQTFKEPLSNRITLSPVPLNIKAEDLLWLYNKSQELGLMPQLHEFITSHPYAFYIKNEHFLNFPLLELEECNCKVFSRFGNLHRLSLETQILDDIVRCFPISTKPLRIMSLGPGGLLQEWRLLSELFKLGFREVDLVFIDPLHVLVPELTGTLKKVSRLSSEQITLITSTEQQYFDEEVEALRRKLISAVHIVIDEDDLISQMISRLDINHEHLSDKKFSASLTQPSVYNHSLEANWVRFKEYFESIGMKLSIQGFSTPREIPAVMPDYQADILLAIDFEDYLIGAWRTLDLSVYLCSSSNTGVYCGVSYSSFHKSPDKLEWESTWAPEAMETLVADEDFYDMQEDVDVALVAAGTELISFPLLKKLIELPSITTLNVTVYYVAPEIPEHYKAEMPLYNAWLSKLLKSSSISDSKLSVKVEAVDAANAKNAIFNKTPTILVGHLPVLQALKGFSDSFKDVQHAYIIGDLSQKIDRFCYGIEDRPFFTVKGIRTLMQDTVKNQNKE